MDDCDCELSVDPKDPTDDWHYDTPCEECGATHWALHCPHELYPHERLHVCPNCRKVA